MGTGLGLTPWTAEEVVWMKSWSNTSRVAFDIKSARGASTKSIYSTDWRVGGRGGKFLHLCDGDKDAGYYLTPGWLSPTSGTSAWPNCACLEWRTSHSFRKRLGLFWHKEKRYLQSPSVCKITVETRQQFSNQGSRGRIATGLRWSTVTFKGSSLHEGHL